MFSTLPGGLRPQFDVLWPTSFLVARREHRWQVLLHAACQQRPVLGAGTSCKLDNSSQPSYNLRPDGLQGAQVEGAAAGCAPEGAGAAHLRCAALEGRVRGQTGKPQVLLPTVMSGGMHAPSALVWSRRHA